MNNAGAAFHGPLMFQPIEDFRKNIEINLIGTLQVTQVRTTAVFCQRGLMHAC